MSTHGSDSNPRPSHPIASVDNALRLLALVGERESVRISEASRVLGVVPSTASRLMAMLQYHGLVVLDPDTRAYRAGPALARIGLNVVERMDIRRLAHPFVERLARELDETTHFLILNGPSVMFVDGVESGRPVRTTRRSGELRPAHCTSGGKAMLATLGPEELRVRYPDEMLATCTPKSIVTRPDLIRELKLIARRGYATSIQESEPDIAAIGAAIRTPGGQLLGALSVSVPMTRYSRANFAAIAERLLAISAAAGEALAFAEPLESTAG